MHVKPAPGRRVLNPTTMQPLPETGAEITLDSYWARRLADGDVLEVPPVIPAPKPTKVAKERE